MEGRELAGEAQTGRTDRSLLDWTLILATSAIFVELGSMAQLPHLAKAVTWAVILTLAMCVLLVGCAVALWRTTHFR
jgi:heme/copper-type cytochrome/quinol oxidase subunit 3